MSLSAEIHKRLGNFQLHVRLQTHGDVLALLGASGCGKSMTLKCIAGIETPDSGKIVLNGRTLFDSQRHINLPPQKRRVGYLFQQYALFPNMNVQQNILAAVRQGTKSQKRAAAAEKIQTFQLQGTEEKKPSQLSGGQQQRVALARIFANEPEVLLLDEPFSALDSYLKWQLELELTDLLEKFGADVVYVSHSRDEVYRLCDKVCVMSNGQTEAISTTKELLTAPGTISAALLSGCKNISALQKVDAHTANCLDWGLRLHSLAPIDDTATAVGIRACDIQFAELEEKNSFPCTIERITDDVRSTVLTLSTPKGGSGRAMLRMEVPKQTTMDLYVGAGVKLTVPPASVMILTGRG